MNAQPEYNPNRIISRGFFGKPVASIDWSLASNESIYSLHKGNVSLSREHGLIGLAAALKFQKLNELDTETETNSVKESLDTKKSDEEIIKAKNEEHKQEDANEIKLSYLSEPVNQITETNPVIYLPPDEESLDAGNSDTESSEEEETEDDVKSDSESDDEEKELDDDVKEILADDSSICCRSDTSNNSISSFSFPMYITLLCFLKTTCTARKH